MVPEEIVTVAKVVVKAVTVPVVIVVGSVATVAVLYTVTSSVHDFTRDKLTSYPFQ